MGAADDDDDVVIEMDVTDAIRADVTAQFRQQLPPEHEFDQASFIEFIMLLVANRRSKSQIRREMAPFVGPAAGALVDWLFDAMNALKPPPPPARPRLASVALAPPPPPIEEPPARPAHRKTSSATRLLTNAAKDAAKSTSSTARRTMPGDSDPSPSSLAARQARFAETGRAPLELRTRRLRVDDDDDGAPKRGRSPRGAVMDQEAKRTKQQSLDRLLDRKLPSARRELQTKRARSPTEAERRRRRSDDEDDEARRLGRRMTTAAARSRDDDERPRATTFKVSLTNDEVAVENNGAGAAEAESRREPKVVFKVPGVMTPLPLPAETAVAAALAAAPKKATRCAFWPKCEKGAACAFIHPTQPCKYWPSCQFGDKCLYVHDKNLPNVYVACKFGTKCTRGADCKFTHAAAPVSTTTTTAMGAVEGQANVCRYDKRCTKISCPFKHPEREKSEYFNDRLRDSHDDDDDEDVTVVLSNTLPSTPPRAF